MPAEFPQNIAVTGRYKLLLFPVIMLLSLPLAISFFTDHSARSQWENRPLSQWPKWKGWQLAPKYFKGLNQFAEDHIGLALASNKIYRRILYYSFTDTPAKNISLGMSNFVFLNSHSKDAPNEIFETLCVQGDNKVILKELTTTVEEIFQAIESREYTLSIGIAPSKPVLYPEYLPGQVPTHYRKACETYRRRDNIPRRLSELSLTFQRVFYYPLDEFFRYRHGDAFYPTENFHWNGASAHLFARGFLSQLGLQPAEDFSAGKKLRVVNADISEIFGFNRSINVWQYPYATYQTKVTYSEPAFVKEYYQRVQEYSRFETGHPMSERRALLITNSFGVYVAPHLAPGFRSLVHVNINYLQEKEYTRFFNNFVDRIKPTDIIFLFDDEALVKKVALSLIRNALVLDSSTEIGNH